jgi:hypothetical protein
MYPHCEYTLLWPAQPLLLLSLTLFLPIPLFFNSFQYIGLKPLPSQMLCFIILLILYPSLFPSLLPQVPLSSSTITNMFYIWVCIWSRLFLCVYLLVDSIFYVCLSMTGLLHLIWYISIVSIYLQTTCCHYSLWVKLHCVYIPYFIDPFISYRASGLFP